MYSVLLMLSSSARSLFVGREAHMVMDFVAAMVILGEECSSFRHIWCILVAVVWIGLTWGRNSPSVAPLQDEGKTPFLTLFCPFQRKIQFFWKYFSDDNLLMHKILSWFLAKLLITLMKKSYENIWPVLKLAIPLHRFSPQNGAESNSKKSSLTCLQRYNVVQENRDINCLRWF